MTAEKVRAVGMSSQRRAIVFVLGATVALTLPVVAWYAGPPWRPARLRFEAVVEDLMRGFGPAAVVTERADAPVRLASIQPSASGKTEGAARRAIVAPPPAVVRFRVRVPADAVLELAIGVQGDGKRNAEAAGVRFRVDVDGREAFARTINPARSRHDRRWLDARVPLAGDAGHEVTVTLRTEVDGPGAHLAGQPGWSHVRILREMWRERQRTRPGAPNVLVLLVDTLRADRLGCYGAAPSPSLALDRLAAGGLVFTQAVSQSSWTMTSVASLFSGLHPRSHGVFGVPRQWAAPAGAGPDTEWGFLSDAIPTLAEHVQRAGITTFGASANPLVSRATNFARGFETFEELEGGRWPPAAAVNARLLRWLRRNRGLRFLAYLHYMDVHGPYAPPDSLRPPPPAGVRPNVARGDVDELARRINWQGADPLAEPEVGYLRALYEGEIRNWDGELATLLAALADLGVLDSTVIVVTADHGEEFQEHARLGHGSQLYDESILVPLVIAGPGVGRGRVGTPAQGIDLFPTVSALLGVAPPPDLPGRNLVAAPEDRPVLAETRYGMAPDGSSTEVVALRTGGWKLLHAPGLGRYELYDLRADPAERRDRFTDAPEAAALVAQLGAWRASPPPAAPPAERDPHLVETLRALGYVE